MGDHHVEGRSVSVRGVLEAHHVAEHRLPRHPVVFAVTGGAEDVVGIARLDVARLAAVGAAVVARRRCRRTVWPVRVVAVPVPVAVAIAVALAVAIAVALAASSEEPRLNSQSTTR